MTIRNLTATLLLGVALAACSSAGAAEASGESVGYDATSKPACCEKMDQAACEKEMAECPAMKPECAEKKPCCEGDKPAVDG